MNWVEHVRAYANRKGISYKDALKDNECKETYHKQKGEQKEVEKGNKEFNKRQSTKKFNKLWRRDRNSTRNGIKQ